MLLSAPRAIGVNNQPPRGRVKLQMLFCIPPNGKVDFTGHASTPSPGLEVQLGEKDVIKYLQTNVAMIFTIGPLNTFLKERYL